MFLETRAGTNSPNSLTVVANIGSSVARRRRKPPVAVTRHDERPLHGASCIIVWGGNHRRTDALREAVSRVRPKNAPVASQRDKIIVVGPWMRPRVVFQDGQSAV